ncbi:ABC transporter substrate-binding protein [Dysosmobacter sp.]|uniref:ABC transporter substrate-binding protein n=1 Tax=Dysosmobacter sp. TaxID=2591382 RepID=UPI003A92ED2A
MRRFVALLLALLALTALSACGATPAEESDSTQTAVDADSDAVRTVVDCYGREVEIPEEVKTVVCTGSGALRMVCYLQCTDRLVGVEDTDKNYETSTLRDYAHVYYETLQALPSIGKGGGTANTAYVEELIALQPDVILSGYSQEALEDLARTTGIPCVTVRALSINFIDESFYTAMEVAADVLGAQARCEEVLTWIDGCKADLSARTADIPEADKPLCYAGAVTYSGTHGFTGTYSNFGPFLAIGARNAADEVEEEGYYDADPEKILSWDPDVIFLDPGSLDLVQEEYASNPGFFDALTAVQTGQIYACVSYNNYSTNVGYAIADAYYAGTVLSPEQFADVDIAAKTDEILEFLLGRGYYGDMTADGLAFGPLEIGHEA